MHKSLFVAALLAMAFAVNAHAGSARILVVDEKIELNAPASKVWGKVGSFGDLAAWHPAIAKSEITSGVNDRQGAVRVLTLRDGGKITEKLNAFSAKNMFYKYEIVEGVLPVSNYVSTISVRPAGAGKSIAAWKGFFQRKDTSDKPVAGQDDETALKTITSVYKGGLENLKKIVE